MARHEPSALLILCCMVHCCSCGLIDSHALVIGVPMLPSLTSDTTVSILDKVSITFYTTSNNLTIEDASPVKSHGGFSDSIRLITFLAI